MLCTILKSFGTATRGYGVGETADFPEKQAREFIELGYVKPEGAIVEMASLTPGSERAVQPDATQRKQRGRKPQ